MNKYEDIDLLRRAMMEDVGFNTWTISTPHLMRFAELVRADERKRIAKTLETFGDGYVRANYIVHQLIEDTNERS